MGIKLDWEIEAEQATVKDAGEDKLLRRRRRMAQLRILLGIGVIVGLFGALYGVIWWRLESVDAEIRRALVDTVEAEVATLRVADRVGYLDIQRSANDVWREAQSLQFDAYQQLKIDYDVQLTGEVVSIDVDGMRGRVQVQEIIEGVPYVQTWFYWRYVDGGWRHVPPDYTYWGEQETDTRGNVTVRYQAVDAPVGGAIADQVASWLSGVCDVVDCETLPGITIDIAPREGLPVGWGAENPWTLQVPSPFVGRARLDRPFDTALQLEVANLLSERLLAQVTGNVEASPVRDAAYLRGAVQDWLVGQFTQLDMESYLVSSYVSRYGHEALGNALRDVSPDSDLRVLNAPAGVNELNELAVDWRDYLTWRINLEAELHAARDQANFIALYDTRTEASADLAFARFNAAMPQEQREVIAVQADVAADGTPELRAVLRVGEGDGVREEIVQFHLIDGLWKRIN